MYDSGYMLRVKCTLNIFLSYFSTQADTPSDTHSLHITLSTYQKNSWLDFMEKVGCLKQNFEFTSLALLDHWNCSVKYFCKWLIIPSCCVL